jgi:hypothetical protein
MVETLKPIRRVVTGNDERARSWVLFGRVFKRPAQPQSGR